MSEPRHQALAAAKAFVAGQRRVLLMTSPPGSAPKARIMGFTQDGWSIELTTVGGSIKTRELDANPRVTLIWTSAVNGQLQSMVQLDGRAERVDGEQRRAILDRKRASGPGAAETLDRLGESRYVAYVVHPELLRVQGLLGGVESFVYRRELAAG